MIPLYRPDWHADANCRGVDPELFFPGQGESTKEAKAVCRACDVQAECLLDALNRGEKHGIWGGLSERERRSIRKQKRGGSEPKPIQHGTMGGYHAHRRRGEEACPDCKHAHAQYNAHTRPSRAAESAA